MLLEKWELTKTCSMKGCHRPLIYLKSAISKKCDVAKYNIMSCAYSFYYNGQYENRANNGKILNDTESIRDLEDHYNISGQNTLMKQKI